jgi:hypothetical protein
MPPDITPEQAARDVLLDLALPLDQPIDPFAAIRRLGLFLCFRPLGDLIGVIVQAQNAGRAGVMINCNEPLYMQRLAGAHEIGHFTLHLGASRTQDGIGDERHHLGEVDGPQSQDEVDARRFSRHFLMPRELLEAAWERRPAGELTPETAYLIARDLGAPYLDALLRLKQEGFITPEADRRLRAVHPREIKRALAARDEAPDGEVWLILEATPPEPLAVDHGDFLEAALDEQAGTGYRWLEAAQFERAAREPAPAPPSFAGPGEKVTWRNAPSPVQAPSPDPAGAPAPAGVLALVEDTSGEPVSATAMAAGPPRRVQVGGVRGRRLRFATTQAGSRDIELVYARPWDPASAVERLVVPASVRPTPAQVKEAAELAAGTAEAAEVTA